MTVINSTPTSEAQKTNLPQLLDSVGYSIWDIHALANGVEALIERSSWEQHQDLRSAMALLREVQLRLEKTAYLVDEGGMSLTRLS